MPVCVNCTHPAPHLYTTYRTKSNIRLGVCSKCGHFLDPLIEHPDLIILLDLILLKPRVYLHLLYNRGTLPLDATASHSSEVTSTTSPKHRRNVLSGDLVRLLGTMIISEWLLRLRLALERTHTLLDMPTVYHGLRILGITLADIGSQLITSTTLCLAILWARGWYPSAKRKGAGEDGRRDNFLPIVIPLTMLYTSVLPVLLQLFLSIWYSTPNSLTAANTHGSNLGLVTPTISKLLAEYAPPEIVKQVTSHALEISEAWNNVDKIWAGTRLLGGMSAGFGLRIVLPTRPWETMAIILGGWMMGTWVREYFGG